MDVRNLVYICSRISKKEVFINKLVVSMQTIEELIKRGYDRVVPNNFNYNMNERSFSNGMMVYKLSK